jgi:hypothetical protein
VHPRQWVSSIDEEVDAWVMALLERDPDKRERDAEQVRSQLRRLSEPKTKGGVAGVSGNRPGLVPKREWPDARTILVDNSAKTPERSTDAHKSPWADSQANEPTKPPTTSPFAGFDTAPDSTPPSPTLMMTPSHGLPPVVMPPPGLEDSTLPPSNRRTQPHQPVDEEALVKAPRGLMVALAITVVTLIAGLIFLFKIW